MRESFESKKQTNPTFTPHPINLSHAGTGYAHSKIILMGEHSVVYDFPAIALPFSTIGVKTTVTLSSIPDSHITCQYYTGPFQQAPDNLNNLKKAAQLTLESLRLPLHPLKILIESTIPQERGMGSSAAVVVSLIRAISDFYQVDLSDYLLRYITNESEVIAHESTSGIDTLVTSSQDPVIYRKSQQARFFNMKMDAVLIVADSGQVGQTRVAVSHVRQLNEKNPEFVQELMENIGRFVNQSYEAILNNEAKILGRLMSYNHYYLNQLGVSNKTLDNLVTSAWLSGALGAKLTGGGMGGCVIALAEDETAAELITRALKDAGAIAVWQMNLND